MRRPKSNGSLPRLPDARDDGVSLSSPPEPDGRAFQAGHRKGPRRVIVVPEDKILMSREEAGHLVPISQRGLDYLVASRRLPTRRIGGRVLIPVAELRQYARCDHPERIVS